MTYEPLHHKYRPQTFADLVGQEAIATTLSNAIRTQRIAPAYLFTGSRGTGKTSSSRILAKSLNCLQNNEPTDKPCGVCDVCQGITKGATLDVIEIDAASNTGVDNIRELIERAQFAPVQCRHKVYIIDEVHMLSTAAFNALLKTLEEPPDRVVFILATTDPQRVLPTIISRCQRFDFRRIPLKEMVQHLRKIADLESIDITDEAITLIAQFAQGGLRDAESLLDQLSLLAGQVTLEKVWDLVGAVPERDLLELLEAIASNQAENVLQKARNLMDRGREPLIVLQNLVGFYRDLLIAKTAPNRNDLVAITTAGWTQLCDFAKNFDLESILAGQKYLKDSEAQIKNTTQPRLWLEVSLLGLLPSAIKLSTQPVQSNDSVNRRVSPPPAYQAPPKTEQLNPVSPPPATPPIQTSQPPTGSQNGITPDRISTPSATPTPPSNPVSNPHPQIAGVDPNQVWQQLLEAIDVEGTKTLWRLNCYLISFNHKNREAWIGISKQHMSPIIKGTLPQIDKAFLRIFNAKVKINFQTGVPAENQPNLVNNEQLPNSVAEPTSYPQIKAADVNYPPTQPTASFREEADEVANAAKNLANFFKGSVTSFKENQPSQPNIPNGVLPSEGNQAHQTLATQQTNGFDNNQIEKQVDDLEDEDDIPF